VVGVRDGDLAGLGPFRDRDPQRQHTGFVVRLDVVGDVVLPMAIGSGTREGWGVSVLHRTLIQTADNPGAASAALARLLAQLDRVRAAGVITVSSAENRATTAAGQQLVEASGPIRFRFTPFPSPDPGATPAPNTSDAPIGPSPPPPSSAVIA
jgi:hypothetical protein